MANGTQTETLIERHKKEALSRREELLPAVEEYNALEDYLTSFGGSSRRRTPQRATPGGGRRRGTRSSGVDRPGQFLAIIEKEPGLTISQIAERINASVGDGERGVSPNYLYRVRDSLLEEKKIEADGDGFKVKK